MKWRVLFNSLAENFFYETQTKTRHSRGDSTGFSHGFQGHLGRYRATGSSYQLEMSAPCRSRREVAIAGGEGSRERVEAQDRLWDTRPQGEGKGASLGLFHK